MLSPGVTKVSKNRHVRRAIRRRSSASAGASASRPAAVGARLLHSATAGAASQQSAIGTITGQGGRSQASRAGRHQQTRPRATGHLPVETPDPQSGHAGRLCGSRPLQHVPVGPEKARRWFAGWRRPCAMPDRKKQERQRRLHRREGGYRPRASRSGYPCEYRSGAAQWEKAIGRNAGIAMAQRTNKLPQSADGNRQEPGQTQRREKCGRKHRPSQIVEDLTQTDRRNGMLVGSFAKDPGQQLPVATRPAVLAFRRDVVAGRELLDGPRCRKRGLRARRCLQRGHGLIARCPESARQETPRRRRRRRCLYRCRILRRKGPDRHPRPPKRRDPCRPG